MGLFGEKATSRKMVGVGRGGVGGGIDCRENIIAHIRKSSPINGVPPSPKNLP